MDSSWTGLSTFQDIGSGIGDMHVANFTFLSRAKRSTCGLPQRCKTLSTMVWFRLHSVFRIWSFLDRWSANTFKCPGMCLGTNVFPDFRPSGICLLLDRSFGGILSPPPLISQVGNSRCVVWHESKLHCPNCDKRLVDPAKQLRVQEPWCVDETAYLSMCRLQLNSACEHPILEYCWLNR